MQQVLAGMDQIRVLLVGGPAALPEAERVRVVGALADTIKLVRGNGYEHFTYSGESHDHGGAPLAVFRWCHRTKVAE